MGKLFLKRLDLNFPGAHIFEKISYFFMKNMGFIISSWSKQILQTRNEIMDATAKKKKAAQISNC